MKKHAVLLTALILSGLVGREALAGSAYMSVTGPRGPIQGGVLIKGREGTMEVTEVTHEIVSPRDAASGLPTGKRQHKPLTITMVLDKSTPLLYKSLVTNETLPTVELKFYRTDPLGKELNYFTVKLTNASLSQVKTVLPDTKDPASAQKVEVVQVSFTYQKIEWTWVDGGITASDDWESPAA